MTFLYLILLAGITLLIAEKLIITKRRRYKLATMLVLPTAFIYLFEYGYQQYQAANGTSSHDAMNQLGVWLAVFITWVFVVVLKAINYVTTRSALNINK